MNPILVNFKDGIKRFQIKYDNGGDLCKMELGRSSRKSKPGTSSEVLKDEEYL